MVPAFNDQLSIVEPFRSGGMLTDAIKRVRQLAPPRTGLHCSTIVNDIIQTLYPRKRLAFLEEETLAYQEFGNVIEDVLATGFQLRNPQWTKPSPRCSRGIWCAPDGWDPVTRTIDEIKATWTSEKDFEDSPKLHGYLLQALEYAYVWNATRLRLHVFFVNGNWRPPVPRPRTFIVRWQPGALEHNDSILRQHAVDKGWLTHGKVTYPPAVGRVDQRSRRTS
jgi:hypothetical protein